MEFLTTYTCTVLIHTFIKFINLFTVDFKERLMDFMERFMLFTDINI